jgi:hypothetical protein
MQSCCSFPGLLPGYPTAAMKDVTYTRPVVMPYSLQQSPVVIMLYAILGNETI